MRIITKKKQDEIIKSALQLTTLILGRKLSPEEIEMCADCMFDIIYKSTGKRGLEEVMESIMGQMQLTAEVILEQLKSCEGPGSDV